MMNSVKKIQTAEELDAQVYHFLTLLASVLHSDYKGRNQAGKEVPFDWKEIFRLAALHQVQPLVFEKAVEYPGFSECSEYAVYMRQAMGLIAGQSRRTEAFRELYCEFDKENLHPIVMKGLVCRQLYGELCDHRVSGDEDILIRREDFAAVKEVLQKQGFHTERENVTEQQLQELQEVTFSEDSSGLEIELHINPMGRETGFRRQMNRYFLNATEQYRDIEVSGTTMRTMEHTDHFLFLILHALKHFTCGGFGIRQVMDILMYEEQFEREIEWDKIEFIVRELGANSFYADLHVIGAVYLGFHLPCRFQQNCPEELLRDIMESGVFGNATQAQCTAVHMTSAAMEVGSRRTLPGRIKIFWHTIFPTRHQMMNFAPELKEHPERIWVEWVKRWGRFLKHNRQNKGGLAVESLKISQDRMRLLKKYKML